MFKVDMKMNTIIQMHRLQQQQQSQPADGNSSSMIGSVNIITDNSINFIPKYPIIIYSFHQYHYLALLVRVEVAEGLHQSSLCLLH